MRRGEFTVKKSSWAGPRQIGMTVLFGMIFLICSCVNGGMSNTVMPTVCKLRGWDYAAVLPFMSYGGFIGAAATLVFGQLVVKKGGKRVIVLGLVLGGLNIALYGSTTSFMLFVATIIGNRVFSCAYQQAGAASMLNSWFPKTKGIVLGWATMGIILADVIWSPYIPKAIAALGLPITLKLVGLAFLGLAVIVICFTKDTPEAAGAYPDNDPESLNQIASAAACAKAYISPFTWKKLLKTRQVWQIGLTWGILWMVCLAFVSQVVGRAVSVGYAQNYGVRLLQISSVVALAGSWFFGWLDVKVGTRKASMVFAAVIVLLFLNGLLHRKAAYFSGEAPVALWPVPGESRIWRPLWWGQCLEDGIFLLQTGSFLR